MKYKAIRIIITLCLLLLFPVLLQAADIHGEEDSEPNRPVFSTSANEQIDPFSGRLILAYTDMRFPGNGGLDLEIIRTYNSKQVVKLLGLVYPKSTLFGYGWNIHFGRFKYVGDGVLMVEMQDGTLIRASRDPALPTQYVSDNYDRVDYNGINPTATVLSLSNGTKIYFGQYGNDGYLYATKISRNNSEIDIYYNTQGYPNEVSHVIDTVGRRINFEVAAIDGFRRLTAISCPDAPSLTVTYGYAKPDPSSVETHLTTVSPPMGDPWQYTYSAYAYNIYELQTVTTPFGGAITYTFDTIYKTVGLTTSAWFRAVSQKSVAGRDVTPGTWSFSYFKGSAEPGGTSIYPDGFDYTVVDDSCDRKKVYRFWGYDSYEYTTDTDPDCYKFGLLDSMWEENSSSQTEYQVTKTWGTSTQYISIVNDSIPYACVADKTYAPLPASEEISRDGSIYTTSYSNYDDYGNPGSVVESGDAPRTTTATYWYNTDQNIVKDRPLSVTVTGSAAIPGTFTTQYTYNNNGQPTSVDKYGVTTLYNYETNGNLQMVTDPNDNETSYTWQYGRVKSIVKPLYTINRIVNWNGTIASETNGRNFSTSFTYDNNLRLTGITPPAGNATTYQYPTDNSYKLEQRGSNYTYSYFDGLGRPSGAMTRAGVTTTIAYRACGLKEYTASNVGDTVYYDSFGRTESIVHQDASSIHYAYSNSNVTITDEENHPTKHVYVAFGNPDEKLLTSVQDAGQNWTYYEYNILGSLTQITQGPYLRIFGYDNHNFLTSEQHPETGSISYTRYAMGQVMTKTDSLGTTTFYYDSHNRLTDRSAGPDSVAYGYDFADNLTSVTNATANMSFNHDGANRLTTQTAVIGGQTYNTVYGYDGNDNLTNLTYPSGLNVIYTYNSLDQVTSASGFGGAVNNVTYYTTGTSIGLMEEMTFSNGITTHYDYNSRNAVSSILAGSNIVDLQFDYNDLRGNMTLSSDGVDPSRNKFFDYDKLNRLTLFDGAWGTGSFTYDSLGNRFTKDVSGELSSYAYSGMNRLASINNTEKVFTYNDNGDLSNIITPFGNNGLTYDRFHNLTQYTQNSIPVASFASDGNGMRVSKTDEQNGKTTFYLMDNQGNTLTEIYSNGNTTDLIHLNGKLVAKREKRVTLE